MKSRLTISFIIVTLFISCRQSNEELLTEGLALKAQGKFEKSVKVYTEVIKRNKKLQSAYYNRGLCYISLKKYPQALTDFTKVIDLHMIGGFVFTYNSDLEFASEEAKAQVSIFDAYYQRAQTKYLMNDHVGSYEDFQYLFNNNYQRSRCLSWQGLLNYNSGDSIKACKCFEKAKQFASDKEDLEIAEGMMKKYCRHSHN